jgi:signal transduction histidine kinase
VHTAEATGLAVDYIVHGRPFPVSAGVELTAYRIAQEALTNVVRHAGARHAQVELWYGAGTLTLSVEDDGQGGAATSTGHGLVGMRERVALYDGELVVGARPGAGWQVKACLPTTR